MKTTNIDTWKKIFPKGKQETIEQCYSIVIQKYSQTNKHYHNLNHIDTLIHQIKQLSLTESDEHILIQVALFHDVVYVPGRKDNEHKSAEFAKKWLSKLNMHDSTSQKICDIIRSTNTHQSSEFLAQLFLDLDLSILGVNEKTYQEYTAQIRKEHIKIPNYVYKVGRKRFLKNMLSREVIFLTSEYYEAYENRARKNLRNELNALKK